jgi:tetratricopeptide (TPR) repeat protein
MRRFIRELRRREVFRTAGLYVGVCWIIIEVSSVLLPTFEAPEWAMRAIIIAAFVGFPIMLVLAWVYDLSDTGVHVQADPTDTIVPPLGSRKMDFIVIGVLSVALVLSIYMNVTGRPGEVDEIPPTSVLIADFDNQTGDPLFEGSLEQALNIGIEGASFITAYSRPSARKLIETISPGTPLNADGARLVAVREGIKLVMSGSISENNGAYRLSAAVVRPDDGEVLSEASVSAKNKLEVLSAVSLLADEVREDLGDTSTEEEVVLTGETFTATSLEAMKNYTTAQDLMIAGHYEESLPYYEAAVADDPNFGRAMSGWALSQYYLGRQDEAARLWEQALSKSANMTPRERYRTQGLYFIAVQGNYAKAVESFATLVERYPADSAGLNNLAVAYFSTLDFDKAQETGRKALEIYPNNETSLSNYALYAMYAGDFESANERARELLELDSNHYMAWLPLAVGALAAGDVEQATLNYESMGKLGVRGASLANLGLADIALYRGKFSEAADLLQSGIEADTESDNREGIATKTIALAQAHADLGDADASRQAIQDALAVRGGLSRQVPAALLYLQLGDVEAATEIASELGEQLQPQSRAYANMILGIIESQAGRHVTALEKMQEAVELSDFWLVRFYLGQAYLAAGAAVEANDEFMLCGQRKGEASAIFLNDQPTWRYMATLPYWLGRAQEAIGMSHSAADNYRQFLDSYQGGTPLVEDAAARSP